MIGVSDAEGFSYAAHGFAELEAQLEELGNAMQAAELLKEACIEAFEPVWETARALVHRRSGALHDAIKLSVVEDPGGDAVIAVGVRIGRAPGQNPDEGEEIPTRRWHFEEFGTAHQAANPFLRPALERNAELVLSILREKLTQLLAETAEG